MAKRRTKADVETVWQPQARFVVAADGVESVAYGWDHSTTPPQRVQKRTPLKKGTPLTCLGVMEGYYSDSVERVRFTSPSVDYRSWVEPCSGPFGVPAPGVLAPMTRNRRARRKGLSATSNDLLEQVSILSNRRDQCAAVRAVLADALDDEGRTADAIEQRAMAGTGVLYYWVRPVAGGTAVGPFHSRRTLEGWIGGGTTSGSLFGLDKSVLLTRAEMEVVTCLYQPVARAVEGAAAWSARPTLCPRGRVRLRLDES